MSLTKRKLLKKKQNEVRDLVGKVVRLVRLNQNNGDVFQHRKSFVDIIEKIDGDSIFLRMNEKKEFEYILYMSGVAFDEMIKEVS